MTRPVGLLAAAYGVGIAAMSTYAASAKTPGHEYCFHGTCHTVKTLEETRRLIGVTTKLKASFYDDAGSDRYNPSNLTSSGEYFRADQPDNAASPIYPDGTKLLVWHPGTRRALMIRVNNAGPYWGDRKLDLSRAAAEKFGITHSGVATVHVQVVEAPTKAEATYRKGRHYPPVRGYIGQFASLDAAATGVFAIPATRLASNEEAKPKPVAEASQIATKLAAPAAASVAVAAVAIPAGTPIAAPVQLAAVARRGDPKPIRLTELDIKLAHSIEREARKFLVAAR